MSRDDMSSEDFISIIVPVYNAEKFVGRAIESVIHQTHKNLELILVNDGSQDNSEAICNEFASTDRRVRVISQAHKGPAAARNSGILNASGNFIFFLDADDFISKDALKALIAGYQEYAAELVMGNFSKLENNGTTKTQGVCFSPHGSPFEGHEIALSKEDMAAYVRHFLKYPSNHLISYCWARLYTASIIKNNGIKFQEDMRLFEDFVFNLRYLRHCEKTVFINEPLYTYTMHNSYISASMAIINSDSLLSDMEVFKEKAGEFLRKNKQKIDLLGTQREIGHALIHYCIIFLVRSCRQITGDNRKMMYREIRKLVNAAVIRDGLRGYCPSKGNSRVLPLLIKLKMPSLIMFVCKQKAFKRYGKPVRN